MDAKKISIDDERYRKFKKAYEYAMAQTQEEVDQAVEGMYHNLNSLQSRSGNQLPFTSINYGSSVETEGRMVIRSLLENSIKGVGKFRKTPIFPCGIFQLIEGVNMHPDDPNYDLFQLALQSTSKRLYPNYVNGSWSVDGCSENTEREKQEIIDSLSEKQRQAIIEAIREDPSIADRLGVSIEE